MSINNDIYTSDGLIIHKDIEDSVPYSDKVNTRIFSKLLDDDKVVASYKMYWLLGILDETSLGNEEIEFKRIIARMITYAWYPILQFKLSFGRFDSLNKSVNYVTQKYSQFKTNRDEKKLLEFLTNSSDSELNQMMKELTYNAPYRLLSPFFSEDLRGLKDSSKIKMITQLSLKDDKCLYKIIKGDNDKIVLNEGWAEYLKNNYRLIKSWIYYKLVCFIQKRNPNVPSIAFKLEAPRNRNLTAVTKLWNEIIASTNIKDIYTGQDFNADNYKNYGVLSIDHFIPWSFVMHDEMWNLTPTFKNINSKKSDNLLLFDNYIDSFCSIQYKAFSYICDKKLTDALEDYMDILRLDNPYDYYKKSSREGFSLKLRQCISPLYQIAENQGFQVINRLL